MGAMTQHADSVIDIVVTLPAPPPRVFAALTEPADINAWMWGNLGPDPQAEVDLRPGGLFDISIRQKPLDDPDDARFSMRGVYVEVDPPRRLVYSLRWFAPVGYNEGDGEPPFDEIVVIDLEPTDTNETTMHYRHFGVPDPAAAREHDKAIRFTFDLLAKHLSA